MVVWSIVPEKDISRVIHRHGISDESLRTGVVSKCCTFTVLLSMLRSKRGEEVHVIAQGFPLFDGGLLMR